MKYKDIDIYVGLQVYLIIPHQRGTTQSIEGCFDRLTDDDGTTKYHVSNQSTAFLFPPRAIASIERKGGDIVVRLTK